MILDINLRARDLFLNIRVGQGFTSTCGSKHWSMPPHLEPCGPPALCGDVTAAINAILCSVGQAGQGVGAACAFRHTSPPRPRFGAVRAPKPYVETSLHIMPSRSMDRASSLHHRPSAPSTTSVADRCQVHSKASEPEEARGCSQVPTLLPSR